MNIKLLKLGKEKTSYVNYQYQIFSYFSPECRVKSDFITPTKYWPENEQSKKELIKAYKENLQ
jgi:hypothetical protein